MNGSQLWQIVISPSFAPLPRHGSHYSTCLLEKHSEEKSSLTGHKMLLDSYKTCKNNFRCYRSHMASLQEVGSVINKHANK